MPASHDWYIYILQCSDKTLYTGIATDVAARLATHNAGKGAKYTRGRLPVALLYCESAETRSAALKREYAIKQMRADAKRQLMTAQVHPNATQISRRCAKKITTCASSGKPSRTK